MFDIVVDYPDSRPAVQDVKECLAHTNLHRKFVAGFKQAIRDRLLHAGSTPISVHQVTIYTLLTSTKRLERLTGTAACSHHIPPPPSPPVPPPPLLPSSPLNGMPSSGALYRSAAAVLGFLHGSFGECKNRSVTQNACAGAATSDIIEQYVSTIKTLREVDPTGRVCGHCLQD